MTSHDLGLSDQDRATRAAVHVDSRYGDLAEDESVVSEPLLPRIASGDRDAVAACLDRYPSLVWSPARRFTNSRTDAEDAVQEISIDLWSNAGRFDGGKTSETTFVALLARRRL